MNAATINRYHVRTWHLPPEGQTYLHLPGIRPNRGTCPECGAPEDQYCDLACGLVDPHAVNMVGNLMRCWRCYLIEPGADGMAEILVVPDRPVKHLLGKGKRSVCGIVQKPRAHGYRALW